MNWIRTPEWGKAQRGRQASWHAEGLGRPAMAIPVPNPAWTATEPQPGDTRQEHGDEELAFCPLPICTRAAAETQTLNRRASEYTTHCWGGR